MLGAVTRQLVSDVPLGCFLSGGIDSSIIAAAMRAAMPRAQPVMTFTIGFDDPRYDETAYAAEVARHLGTEHRRFVVRIDAATDLPRLAAAFGEPFGDSSALPTHYLSRETRGFVKVALSGDGGDELFGGYDRYRAMRLSHRIDSLGPSDNCWQTACGRPFPARTPRAASPALSDSSPLSAKPPPGVMPATRHCSMMLHWPTCSAPNLPPWLTRIDRAPSMRFVAETPPSASPRAMMFRRHWRWTGRPIFLGTC